MFFKVLIFSVIKGASTHIIGTGVVPTGCDITCMIPSVGVWSEWSNWSVCAFLFGSFSQSRFRSCSTSLCPGGSFQEARPCVSDEKQAEWGEWSPWSSCSTTCGEGTMSRNRICKNAYSNYQCQGVAVETQPCNNQPCCALGPWSEWSACSVTCGTGGVSYRTRQCSCSIGCTGSTIERTVCNAQQPCTSPPPPSPYQRPQEPQNLCVSCCLPYPQCIICTQYQAYPDGK